MSDSDEARIKKLVDQNPNVDARQLKEGRAMLKRLEREGVSKPRYEIVSPYERRPLRKTDGRA